MIDCEKLARHLRGTALEAWCGGLGRRIDEALSPARHGNLEGWLAALAALPDVAPSTVDLSSACVRAGVAADLDDADRDTLKAALTRLAPWRKGPFDFFGVVVDTEWRSDLKWDRLAGAIEPLEGRRVLDVGCGSGYHCWRMAGAGATTVVGVEPMPLYVVQFLASRRYLGDQGVYVLPLKLEDLPGDSSAFDTTFSMGVLYHRRSPLDHLRELKATLRRGGQLVLETLVVEGPETRVLMPRGRYARMGNVWFIPSVGMLTIWLQRLGFERIEVVDVGATRTTEQRATAWMPHESLAHALDPGDASLTIEGHPAPLRAILTAIRR